MLLRKKLQLNSCVIWLTYKCNLRCPYCPEWEKDKYWYNIEVHDKNKWVDAIDSLHPLVCDITGGEPSLHPAFYAILNEVKTKHFFAITSNLTVLNLNMLPSSRPLFVTLSWHPSSQMNIDLFISKAKELREFKNIQMGAINFVATKKAFIEGIPQFALTNDYKKIFEENGFIFHVDPDFCNPNWTEDEAKIISQIESKDRGKSLQYRLNRKKYCSAGMTHVQVYPDGSMAPCGNLRTHILGNLFENGTKNLYTSFIQCDSNKCMGCDADAVVMLDANRSIVSKGKYSIKAKLNRRFRYLRYRFLKR